VEVILFQLGVVFDIICSHKIYEWMLIFFMERFF